MVPMEQATGVGVDIVSVERVRAAVERSEAFLKRNFSEGELSYCLPRSARIEHLAARFAAKEAVGKALRTGVRPTQVEIVHDSTGAPVVRLSGLMRKEHSDKRVLVSISHDGGYAVAFCVVVPL